MEAGWVRQFKAERGAKAEHKATAPDTSVSWPRRYVWSAGLALLGGLILRLWMLEAFPQANGDAIIYGTIAKNLLLHGQFALTDGSGVVHPTLIRLPGYPFFLAMCFRLFGLDNYNAVAGLQTGMELGACVLLADFVRRVATPRAGVNTLWLSALCPFTAVYTSAPLTESLTFDMICVAIWALERCLSARGEAGGRFAWGWLLLFAGAISYAAIVRPDGALLAVALWPTLIFSRPGGVGLAAALRPALFCALLSILPFVAWTVRNWQAFHVFEPLAPRYANDPGEDPHRGWQRWVKTWCLDFTCTTEIYWNVPDGVAAFDDLPVTAPNPAFDSPQQEEETLALFDEYNRDYEITPAMDARFEALAKERATAHPLRTWMLLPLGRLADMTLRPRVENLNIDLRWWEYWSHYSETRFSVAYGVLNLLLLQLGVAGFFYRPRLWPYMATYLALRCLLLLTIEAPETRYTLEFFPVIFALGGIKLERVVADTFRRGWRSAKP
jgi:hypothetical protein